MASGGGPGRHRKRGSEKEKKARGGLLVEPYNTNHNCVQLVLGGVEGTGKLRVGCGFPGILRIEGYEREQCGEEI